MNKITSFLWFNDNAEDAAEFYLLCISENAGAGELRSSGAGTWPARSRLSRPPMIGTGSCRRW